MPDGDACEKCGQVHDPNKCTGHATIREGGDKPWDGTTRKKIGIRPCGQWPLKGLDVCKMHGGKAPQAQAKAAERLAAEAAAREPARRGPDPEVAARRAQALKLRLAGALYEDIARQLGYSSRGAAVQDVQRALAVTMSEPAEELRALEVQRLDMLWQTALKVLSRHHITVSNGKVVTLDGQAVKDDGPVLQAIDRLLKIQERRAKYLGLDAPKQVEVITGDLIDREIQRLEQELDQRQRELDSADVDETEAPEGAARTES